MKSFNHTLRLKTQIILLSLLCLCSAVSATQSDIPTITTDVCGSSVITNLEGLSSENQGSMIRVYTRQSESETKTLLGSAEVSNNGSWRLVNVALNAGTLISATATAVGEDESDFSTEVKITIPPVLSLGTINHPTLCGSNDGSIELLGLEPLSTYLISYTDNSGNQVVNLNSDALGSISVTGLAAGEFQTISASINDCESNLICSVTLNDPVSVDIGLGVPVQPIVCGGTGSILLTGAPLQALDYEVSYYDGVSTINRTITSNPITGIVTIDGLVAGTYSNFSMTRDGCESNVLLDRVVIYDGLLPSAVALGTITQPTSCTSLDGSIELTNLLPNTSYDLYYEDEEGLTISLSLSTPLIGTSIVLPNLGEGTYRNLRVSNLGCFSSPLSDVDLNRLSAISLGTVTQPSNCSSANGSIQLTGLAASQSFTVSYEVDGVDEAVSVSSDASGIITLNGLEDASYSEFVVTQGDCQSNILDDIVTLNEVEAPSITLGNVIYPSACGVVDGVVELLGLLPTVNYDVNFENTSGIQTTNILSDGLGVLQVTGLADDIFKNFSVTINGCTSNVIACPINLKMAPIVQLDSIIPTSCTTNDGAIILKDLDANTTYDVTYQDSNGAQEILGISSDASGKITLSNLGSDTYSSMAVRQGLCTSTPLSDIIVWMDGSINPIIGTTQNPTACGVNDGYFEIEGLGASAAYEISLVQTSGLWVDTLTSDGSGNLIVSGLEAGVYQDIKISTGSCSVDVTGFIELTCVNENTAPVALNDTLRIDEGEFVAFNILTNDYDSDGQLDTVSVNLTASANNGMSSYQGNGIISYQHNNIGTNLDSIKYTIRDNEGLVSNEATIVIFITAANNTPNAPVAVNDTLSVDEGASATFASWINDYDTDGQLDTTSVSLTAIAINGASALEIGFISYQHDGSETTLDSIKYTILDDEGLVSNEATIIIMINPVNDAPIADDDLATVESGSEIIINLAEGDVDVDGTLDLNSISIISSPIDGTLVDNRDGTVTYFHNGESELDDDFTYTIKDNLGLESNEANVSIQVETSSEIALKIPDVFTPNNDGVNDTWEIKDIEMYPDNVVKIFNRWGNEVMEIKGYDNAGKVWSSESTSLLRFSGNRVPDGTYFYVIQLEKGAEMISGFVVVAN